MRSKEEITLEIDNIRAAIGSVQNQISLAVEGEDKENLNREFNMLCDELTELEMELWEVSQPNFIFAKR